MSQTVPSKLKPILINASPAVLSGTLATIYGDSQISAHILSCLQCVLFCHLCRPQYCPSHLLHRAFPTGEGKGDRDIVCWAARKLSLDMELEHCFLKEKKIPLLLWLICSLRLSWRETLCAPPECWEDEVAVIIFMQILLRSRGS